MYVELVEEKLSNRNRIVEFGSVPRNPVNHCRYISLFPFDKGIIDYVKSKGSVSSYKGLHYCPAIIIDIDNENLIESQQSAILVVKRLCEDYLCSLDCIRIYFSGNKGFHIALNGKLFGNIPPHNDIAEYVKLFVLELTKGISHVDTKIYEPMRIFRCTNSLNEKSNLYKIPITFDELNGFIEDIKILAAAPRIDLSGFKFETDIVKNDRLYNLLASIRIEEKNKAEISTGFFSPPAEGERNNKLFTQACMLFDKSEIHSTGITEIIKSINSASEKPLPEFEVQNIVRSAQTKTARKEKENELVLKTFGEWADEWYESILPEKNKLTLKFPNYDKEMKGKLRGKLVCIVGAGGTKKSLFAQNIVLANIENDMRSIYSTMEMGVSELESRFIDMAVESDDYNFSFELELMNRANPGIALTAVKQDIAKIYNDKLLITQNNGMTCKQYIELIERANSEIGTTDILIVDGLSMMGGNATETELVNKHTKELKELAVKFNLMVIAIVHVTKEADATTRDYTKYLRGSGKIYDNLDLLINMSLFRDNFTDDFIKNRGFARLINKRGSGNQIDIVYEFERKRLLLSETDENLNSYK